MVEAYAALEVADDTLVEVCNGEIVPETRDVALFDVHIPFYNSVASIT